jgi:hypothetical protein
MRTSPLQTQLSEKTKQRRLRFGCKSATVNGELKYACWKKFSDGDWRNTQELGRVHPMVKWLNSLDPLPASLMSRAFDEWRGLYTAYLKQHGMYRQGTTFRMDREQQPRVSSRDSQYISTLRQVCFILRSAYDDRPEHEKDVWDLQRMAIISVRKSHLLDLRNFLETAARERWLPIEAERMIFDDEIPRPPKAQPRYLPAAVLDQLNSHLGSLKAPWIADGSHSSRV